MAIMTDTRFFAYLPKGEDLTTAKTQVILIMFLLCYHLLLQIDFACPCQSDRNMMHCYSYMVLPSLIIISLILWTDKRIGRIFRYACHQRWTQKGRLNCRPKFCLEFFTYLLQATSSGFLWCGSVLVDGDWYVCCGTNNAEDLMMFPCMEESELSFTEKAKKIHLKNQAMVIGLGCILLTAACSFLVVLPWSMWCTRRNHIRSVFEEAILEQTEIIVWREIEKAAAEYVTTSLASLSTSKAMTIPSLKKNGSEDKQTAGDGEKALLNVNDINWEKLCSLADVLIENIPNKVHNHDEKATPKNNNEKAVQVTSLSNMKRYSVV